MDVDRAPLASTAPATAVYQPLNEIAGSMNGRRALEMTNVPGGACQRHGRVVSECDVDAAAAQTTCRSQRTVVVTQKQQCALVGSSWSVLRYGQWLVYTGARFRKDGYLT